MWTCMPSLPQVPRLTHDSYFIPTTHGDLSSLVDTSSTRTRALLQHTVYGSAVRVRDVLRRPHAALSPLCQPQCCPLPPGPTTSSQRLRPPAPHNPSPTLSSCLRARPIELYGEYSRSAAHSSSQTLHQPRAHHRHIAVDGSAASGHLRLQHRPRSARPTSQATGGEVEG